MSVISLVGSLNVNTGAIDGDVTRGNPQMMIFGSGTFSPANYATAAAFQTQLIAKTKLARGSSQKLYPLPVIQGTADKTVAPKTGTLGYGLQFKLLRSKPGYEFDILAGSSLEKQLIKFDKKIIPIIILDDGNNFWGVSDVSSNFFGAQYLVGVEPRAFGDASNVKTTKVEISIINSADFIENAAGVNAAINTTSIVGLNDVTLTEQSAHTSNVYHIYTKVLSAIFGQSVDLSSVFASTLASASLWVATNALTGASIPITSVALNAAGYYDITLDTTTFSALSAGAAININLAAPSVLDAAGVTNVEGVVLQVIK